MKHDRTASNLSRQADAARDLIAALGEDDEALTHDMVEGETGLFEAVEAAIAEIDECAATIDGCKAREKVFADRRKRAENRKERLRGLIEQALTVADLPSMKLATATLSVRDVKPAPIVSDEASIPTEFWKAQDPKLDLTAIREAVSNGKTIPGVTMTNGTTSLQIRRQ